MAASVSFSLALLFGPLKREIIARNAGTTNKMQAVGYL